MESKTVPAANRNDWSRERAGWRTSRRSKKADGVWDDGVYGRREGRDALRGHHQYNPEVPFAC